MIRIPVIDAAQARAWDERARTTAKIPSRVLMESAGRGVVHVLAHEFGRVLRHGVVVAAGQGNNGGDGWVAARALRMVGVPVWGVEAGGKRSPDCAATRALALASGVELLDPDEPWPDAGVMLDALLGTGASGAPRGAIAQLAARVSQHGPPVAAVDGPTGLDLATGRADGPVRAALTVTFGGVRRGHLLAREWCGKIVVIDIGFPPPDPEWPELVGDSWARERLPPFRVDMHKGDRGRVLVIGGEGGMAGAALHAASAALEAGAGLVKLAAPSATVAAAQAALPDVLAVTTALGPELEPALRDALAWAGAIVLGPGLGRAPERSRFVAAVLDAAAAPVVIDADALHVGLDVLRRGKAPRVLTPHAGEFSAAFPKLASQLETDRFAATRRAAETLPVVSAVLLKGVPTVIAAVDGRELVVASGNPALATGGSGDLLAGFIGGMLARELEPLVAAGLGAQILGRAAEIAAGQLTVRSTRPADVLAALPELWRTWAEPGPVSPPILLELEPPSLV